MSNTIKLGNLNISSFKVGGSDCSIYLGTAKVYPQDSPTDYSTQYLTCRVQGGTYFIVTKSNYAGQKIEYSLDSGSTWVTLSGNNTPTVPDGGTIMFKGTLSPYSSSGCCSIRGGNTVGSSFSVEGNAMSLMYGDNFIGETDLTGKNYAFKGLFANSRNLTSVANLVLPATTLSNYCYNEMFNGCTALTDFPTLPATDLTFSCYHSMFSGCTGITSAENFVLPATTMASNCYASMFDDCKSLTTAPSLPATTLNTSCYSSMFNGCSGLTTPPELPSTTLSAGCYQDMFSGCTSLTTAPVLPAQSLPAYCYGNMFDGCTNLNSVTCLATDISGNSCTKNWLRSVSDTGTFTKAASMTRWGTGSSGIPSSWTVQDAS